MVAMGYPSPRNSTVSTASTRLWVKARQQHMAPPPGCPQTAGWAAAADVVGGLPKTSFARVIITPVPLMMRATRGRSENLGGKQHRQVGEGWPSTP